MISKILLVSMMYGYGIKERGYSYEYLIMYDALKKMIGDGALFFDFMIPFNELGKEAMNDQLLSYIKKEKPNITIFFLFQDQILPQFVREINNYTKTICYFWDDQWRIKYATNWIPHFNYFTTPDYNGIRKWRDRGFNNAIYSPFGCNQHIYRKIECEKKYEVSFIGMYHPYREWLISRLRRAGINVNVFGIGWKAQNISFDELVNIVNQSKINLNISNSVSLDLRYVFYSHRSLRNVLSILKSGDIKNKEQIKGRHFEINGCGGFQLSFYVEGLEHCYEIGKEIAIYLDPDDLIEKIKYYLKNDEERETIADAGYKRTLTEHIYEKRFQEMFEKVGVKYESSVG